MGSGYIGTKVDGFRARIRRFLAKENGMESQGHQTIIHIDLRDDGAIKQRSYSLKETLTLCRLDSHALWSRSVSEFADFWRADNHQETVYEPGKRGRKNRPDPRYHPEHVEYMLAAINGLMTETEARDLWNLRKGMIRDDLTSRALSLAIPRRRQKRKD